MRQMIQFFRKLKECGQGEIEYALLLMLVGAIVLGGLTIVGSTLSGAFFHVSTAMNTQQQASNNDSGTPATAIPSRIFITKAEYDSDDHRLKLEATYAGSFDPNVMLIVSPGGAIMEGEDNHYEITIAVYGCPCNITITASTGDIATVTVSGDDDDDD